jgi:hypothetical protein
MSVSGSGFGARGDSPTLEVPVACGIGTSPHRTVPRVAMDKANKTLAAIAAARALVAAPVGDLEARSVGRVDLRAEVLSRMAACPVRANRGPVTPRRAGHPAVSEQPGEQESSASAKTDVSASDGPVRPWQEAASHRRTPQHDSSSACTPSSCRALAARFSGAH